MSTKTPDLTKLTADDLAAEIARRDAEAAAQQEAAEAAWNAERANRARKILDAYQADEERLLEAEGEAYDRFRAAVLADPMVAAFVDYRWHRYRRTHLRTEANLAAHILEESVHIPDLTYRDPRFMEEVLDIAEREAGERAAVDSAVVTDSLQGGA